MTEIYCVSCKKYNSNKNSSVRKNKQNTLIILSNCAFRRKEKSISSTNKELHNFND